MENDLISRQAAIDALGEEPEVWSGNDEYAWGLNNQWHYDVNVLEALPSAQPKTIRCKECKHQIKEWRDDKRLKDKGYWVYGCKVISDICGYWALFGQDDDFCSEAERKTDGTD